MLEQIDFRALASSKMDGYYNQVISNVNDHVVRLSTMVEPCKCPKKTDSLKLEIKP